MSAAPTTAAAPVSDEEAALAGVKGAYDVWRECIRDLPNCDTASFAEYLANPQLRGDRALIAEWQAKSYVVENVDTLTYEVLEVHLEYLIPYLVVCERDSSTVLQRLPDHPDQLITQYADEFVREAHLARTDEGWRVTGFARREGTSCP